MFASHFNVLKSYLSAEPHPTKVIDVKSDNYIDRPVHCREDGMILYAPTRGGKKEKEKFEIVLHPPYTDPSTYSFSLFRTESLEDAETCFLCLKDKLPVLVEVAKETCNVNGLQNICDTLKEHPSWTLAHIAAALTLHNAFSNVAVNSHLNTTDPDTGMSPLQVALTTNDLKLVQLLVASKCSLEHLDNKANSVFHYAATTNRDIISTLSQESPRCLNQRNTNGHTPLHMACLADKPDCVHALLMAGADANICASHGIEDRGDRVQNSPSYIGDFLQDHLAKIYTQDMKFGGTPLHWSCSREIVEALIEKGCDINALNFDGRTALHIMVMRNRLECVIALLSHDAEVNIADGEGNTALHLAVKQQNVSLVQALVIFEANLDFKNNKGITARHIVASLSGEVPNKILYILHSVGASRCGKDISGCTDGCKTYGKYSGIMPPSVLERRNRDILNQMVSEHALEKAKKAPNKAQGGRLLSLDGGGIRGLVLIQMLLEIEKHVKRPITHCFDWIAGTSTGGILALGLACGKTLKECLCIYFRMKQQAFLGSRPYADEPLEVLLKDVLGTDTVMTDIKHPKVMVTGVMADHKPVDLHMFRNYECASDVLNIPQSSGMFMNVPTPQEQLIWHVARATGAAPSYFRSYEGFIDGGLIANNPTLDAMTEIHERNLALETVGRDAEVTPLSLVLSLGTGLVPLTPLRNIDVFFPGGIYETIKLYSGMSAIGLILIDQATCTDGRVVDRARAWCSMIGVPYFRFTPQMSEDVAMDEKTNEKLVNMLWETKVYMHSNNSVIKKLAAILSEN